MSLNLTKPYRMRNGREAWVARSPNELMGGETLIGWMIDDHGQRSVATWHDNGCFTFSEEDSPYDLIGEHFARPISVRRMAAIDATDTARQKILAREGLSREAAEFADNLVSEAVRYMAQWVPA